MRRTMMVDPISIGLILVILLAGGLYALPRIGVPVSPNSLYIAENTYLGALDLGVAYRHACLGTPTQKPVLARSCRSTLVQIQKADATAGKLYLAVRGHESSVDAATGAAFISAADGLKALVGG